MKEKNSFVTIDPNELTQVGSTRFFEMQVSGESIERFIKDLELFEKKRSEEEPEQ